MHIAAPALATLRDHRRITRHHQVRERLAAVFVEDDRAGRYPHEDIVGAVPVLFLATSRLAVLRDQPRLIFEIEQRRQAFIDLENYAPTAPAIAARGPAERPILLAQKRNRPIAALPGVHEYPGFINKSHRRCYSPSVVTANRMERGYPRNKDAGYRYARSVAVSSAPGPRGFRAACALVCARCDPTDKSPPARGLC